MDEAFIRECEMVEIDLIYLVVQLGNLPEHVYGKGSKDGRGIIAGANEEQKMVMSVNPLASSAFCRRKAFTCGWQSTSSMMVSVTGT
jgi:hypothetical protein